MKLEKTVSSSNSDQTERSVPTLEQLTENTPASERMSRDRSSIAPGIHDGRVVAITPDGDILVQIAGAGDSLIECDYLQASSADEPIFSAGSEVLVHLSSPSSRGCVMGLKKRYSPQVQTESSSDVSDEATKHDEALPEHVVIKAGQSLSLQCGETSRRITKEGKILIKGVDILAKAKRTHRIKGGSVAIN